MFVRLFAILFSMLFIVENSHCNDSFFIARYGIGSFYKKVFTKNCHFQNFKFLELSTVIEGGMQIIAKLIYSDEFNVSSVSYAGFIKSKFGLYEAGVYRNFGNFCINEYEVKYLYLSNIKYSLGAVCGIQCDFSYNDNPLIERFSKYVNLNSKYFFGPSVIAEILANGNFALKARADLLAFLNSSIPKSQFETMVNEINAGVILHSSISLILSTLSCMSVGVSVGYRAYSCAEKTEIDIFEDRESGFLEKMIAFDNEVYVNFMVSIYEY